MTKPSLYRGSLILLLIAVINISPFIAHGVSNGNLVYTGRIVKPDGSVINAGTISFQLRIYDTAKNCLLWAENQNQDMSGSQGAFSLTIGTGTRVDGGSHSLIQAFTNAGTLSSLTCGVGSTYSPGTTDDRQLVVSFNDGSETVALNPMPIKAVPFALQAEQVNGYGILNLARISGAGSSNTFTPLKHDFLFNLSAAGSASATPCASGEILKFNGTAWACAADATGGGSPGNSSYSALGLVQFNTDASTSGITVASGVATINSGTAANQIVKLDGTAKLPAVDGSALTSLSASNISSGTLPVARGGTNSGTALNNNRIMVSNAGAITEAAALTNGQLLIGSTGAAPVAAAITAGSGITVTNAAGSITIAATGGGTVTNVTGSGAISSSGGATPAISIADSAYGTKGAVSILTDAATSGLTVASGVLSVNSGTAANQIVKLTAAGKYPAVDGSLITNISASNLGSTVVPVANGGTNSSTALTNGKVMVSTGGAIVEGMASNTANSANTFVMRDGSGNINAALGTFAGVNVSAGSNLTLNGSTSGNVVVASPAAPTSYTLTLPTGAGTAGQVLSTNGSGVTSWISALTSTTGFLDGGNSFGANASIGTNDNFDLDIKTNNTSKVTVKAVGNVGIGTTAPGAKLHVVGSGTAAFPAVSGSTQSGLAARLQGAANNAILDIGGNTTNGAWLQSTNKNDLSANYPLLLNPNGGSVGIGTTAPTGTLQVNGSISTIGNGDLPANSGGTVRIAGGFGSPTAGKLYFGDGTGWKFHLSKRASSIDQDLFTFQDNGNLGIGTTTPAVSLDLSSKTDALALPKGTTAEEPASPVAGYIRFNSTTSSIEFYNGSSWQTLGVSGSGLTTLGGQTASTQTFATGTSGTAPAINSASNVHTLNIPMASTASVTAGLISKTDYDAFNAKLGSSTAFSGDVSGTASTTAVDKIKGTSVTITSLTSGNFLKYNGTAWVNANLNAGDIASGTLPVANGGTNSSTALTNGKVMVSTGGAIVEGMASNTASSANTFVMRDGSGNISAALGTFDGVNVNAGSNLTLNGSTSGNVVVASPAAPTSYTLTLPTGAGTAGQVLSTNGSGITSWISALTSNNGFINGGNSFGANASIGTNDNFDLDIKTNNTSKITVKADGKIGVGTASPVQLIDIWGTGSAAAITRVVNPGSTATNIGAAVVLESYSNSQLNSKAYLSLRSSRGTSSSPAFLQSADVAGQIDIGSYNGTQVSFISTPIAFTATENWEATKFGHNIKFNTIPNGTTTPMERMRISPDGSVGINTITPSEKFEISGGTLKISSVTGSSTNSSIYLNSGINTATTNGYSMSIAPWLNGSGTVTNAYGIHIASPTLGTGTFTNYDGVSVNATTGGSGTNTAIRGFSSAASAGTNIGGYFSASGASTANYGLIVSNGNVGFGTTAPTSLLDINGDLALRGSAAPALSAAGTGKIYFDSTANKFKVSQNGGAFADLVAAGGGGTVTSVTGSGAITSTGGTTPDISIVDSAYGTKGAVSILTNAATSGLTIASGVLSVNSGTAANQIVKLDGSSKLPAVDGSALTNLSAANVSAGTLAVARGGTNSSTALTNGKVMISSAGAIVEGMASNTASSANTFVMRDGSGNINGALGTFAGVNIGAGSNLTLNGSTSGSVVVASPAAPTSYTLTLPTSAGTSGQVLSTNGSGVTSWATALTSTTGFINGGNSFGANATIGTNDNFDLAIKTNNTSKITVKADGKVGVGTATPTALADFYGGNSTDVNLSLDNGSGWAEINIYEKTTGTYKWAFGSLGDTQGGGLGNAFFFQQYSNKNDVDLGALNRLVISDDGNIGIGTNWDAPTSLLHTVANGAKTAAYTGHLLTTTATSSTASINKVGVDIQSTGTWNGASGVNTGLNVNASGGATNYAATFTGGNVGIGTTTPASTLHVDSASTTMRLSSSSAGQYSILRMEAYDSGSAYRASYLNFVPIAGTNQSYLSVTNGASNLFVARMDGNIGVNTTSPAAKLDITDTSTTTSAVIVPRAAAFTGTAANGMVRYNTTSNLFEFRQNGSWVNYTTVSDARLKSNVREVAGGLDMILKLRPVYYEWDRTNPRTQSFKEQSQVGFIAQEVEKIVPQVVDKGEDGYRSLEYGKLTSIVVAAMQELHKKVIGNKQDLASISQDMSLKISNLEQENARLRTQNSLLQIETTQLKKSQEVTNSENKAIKSWICSKDAKAKICQ